MEGKQLRKATRATLPSGSQHHATVMGGAAGQSDTTPALQPRLASLAAAHDLTHMHQPCWLCDCPAMHQPAFTKTSKRQQSASTHELSRPAGNRLPRHPSQSASRHKPYHLLPTCLAGFLSFFSIIGPPSHIPSPGCQWRARCRLGAMRPQSCSRHALAAQQPAARWPRRTAARSGGRPPCTAGGRHLAGPRCNSQPRGSGIGCGAEYEGGLGREGWGGRVREGPRVSPLRGTLSSTPFLTPPSEHSSKSSSVQNMRELGCRIDGQDERTHWKRNKIDGQPARSSV